MICLSYIKHIIRYLMKQIVGHGGRYNRFTKEMNSNFWNVHGIMNMSGLLKSKLKSKTEKNGTDSVNTESQWSKQDACVARATWVWLSSKM